MKTKKHKINYNSFYQEYNYLKRVILNKLSGMLSRCENKNNNSYKYYGYLGIKVCSTWKNNPENFIGWCLDNNCRSGIDIHRLNPHKDYEPDNCILCNRKEHSEYHTNLNNIKKELKLSMKEYERIEKLWKFYIGKGNKHG